MNSSNNFIRLKTTFTDYDGVTPINVTDVRLNIYDRYRFLVDEIVTGIENPGVGEYYYDYEVPEFYSGPLVYEYRGTFEGVTLKKRGHIDREWVAYHIKGLLLEWAKDYCNDDFIKANENGVEYEVIPAGVRMFVEEATKYYTKVTSDILEGSVTSESLGDYTVGILSVAQLAIGQGMPAHLLALIQPYRRWVFL